MEPESPVNGDVWFSGGALNVVISGKVQKLVSGVLGEPLKDEEKPYVEPEPEPVLPSDPEERRLVEMFNFLDKRRKEESPEAPAPSRMSSMGDPAMTFTQDVDTGISTFDQMYAEVKKHLLDNPGMAKAIEDCNKFSEHVKVSMDDIVKDDLTIKSLAAQHPELTNPMLYMTNGLLYDPKASLLASDHC